MTFVYLVELHYLPKLVPMLTQSLVAVSGHSFVTKIDTAGFFLSTYVTTQTHEAGPKDINIHPSLRKLFSYVTVPRIISNGNPRLGQTKISR